MSYNGIQSKIGVNFSKATPKLVTKLPHTKACYEASAKLRTQTSLTSDLNLDFSLFLAGVIVNIECKAWTQNIRHADFERKDRKGSVHFEIMIDEPKKN